MSTTKPWLEMELSRFRGVGPQKRLLPYASITCCLPLRAHILGEGGLICNEDKVRIGKGREHVALVSPDTTV